jgi:hypothetical protein
LSGKFNKLNDFIQYLEVIYTIYLFIFFFIFQAFKEPPRISLDTLYFLLSMEKILNNDYAHYDPEKNRFF